MGGRHQDGADANDPIRFQWVDRFDPSCLNVSARLRTSGIAPPMQAAASTYVSQWTPRTRRASATSFVQTKAAPMAHVPHAGRSRIVAGTRVAADATTPGTSTDADPLSVMALEAAVYAVET